LTVIHVGVPVDELGRQTASLARERPLVVAVGRLVPKKGMDVLVRAVADLAGSDQPVLCEIIGDGPERGRLQALVAELGVAPLVTLRGGLPPAEARRRVAEADLFALACLRAPNGDMDGIPVALMEAMAASTPVISTRLSGIPELIADGESGLLVEPGDVDGLATAIRRLAEDSALAARLAAGGRRRVAEDFDQATNARQLLTAIVRARKALGAAG
jgi:glycosyltransferase involved in cell wall biosynthesis